jgi:hypothetical protein
LAIYTNPQPVTDDTNVGSSDAKRLQGGFGGGIKTKITNKQGDVLPALITTDTQTMNEPRQGLVSIERK